MARFAYTDFARENLGSALADVGRKYTDRRLVYATCCRIYWVFERGLYECVNDGLWNECTTILYIAIVSAMYLLHSGWIFAHVVDTCQRKTVYAGIRVLSFGDDLCRRVAGKPCKSKGFGLVLKKIRLILW